MRADVCDVGVVGCLVLGLFRMKPIRHHPLEVRELARSLNVAPIGRISHSVGDDSNH